MTELDPDDVAVRRIQDAVRLLARLTAGRARTGVEHHDADDAIGTVATDDAFGFDPLPLLRAFDECGAKVVVIGQVAGIMHGSGELTGDLDLLWDGSELQAQAVAAAFASMSASLADDDENPLACDATAFSRPKVLFRTASASGDCCTPALRWGSLPVDDFLSRCNMVSSRDGFKIRYLAIDDLVLMRRTAGRAKDVRRADELERLARA